MALHSIKEVLLGKAAEGRLSADLSQITRFHLSMILTNRIMALHSIKEVLLAKAAEGGRRPSERTCTTIDVLHLSISD